MKTVTVHELQNDCEALLDRVARGEKLIVTRDGAEVAELVPPHRPALAATELIERRRSLPKIDPGLFLHDIEDVLDSSV
jgi:prevent-host-death family protein